jgi:hypothetical protein
VRVRERGPDQKALFPAFAFLNEGFISLDLESQTSQTLLSVLGKADRSFQNESFSA